MNSLKVKASLTDSIIDLLKDSPKTITELTQLTSEQRTTIRGRLSDMRRKNYVVKLKDDRFDLNPLYRKGL